MILFSSFLYNISAAILIWLATGRKEIIVEFKALVSSFPEKMGSMQNQLAKHKEIAADIHCLRANVNSLTNILDRKVIFVTFIFSAKLCILLFLIPKFRCIYIYSYIG